MASNLWYLGKIGHVSMLGTEDLLIRTVSYFASGCLTGSSKKLPVKFISGRESFQEFSA